MSRFEKFMGVHIFLKPATLRSKIMAGLCVKTGFLMAEVKKIIVKGWYRGELKRTSQTLFTI